MSRTLLPIIEALSGLLRSPAEALHRLADDADEIWAPFLTDEPIAVATVHAGDRLAT